MVSDSKVKLVLNTVKPMPSQEENILPRALGPDVASQNGSLMANRMKVALRKAGAWVIKAWGYVPLTLLGLAYMILLYITFKNVALKYNDIVWTSASVALAVVGVLMIVAVSLEAISLAYGWKKAKEEGLPDITTCCNAPSCKSGLVIKLWPIPLVNISIKWIDPPGFEVECEQSFTELKERITARHRCSVEKLARRFSVTDVLGLANVTWVSWQNVGIKAYPESGKMQRSNVTMSMSGGEDISDPFGDPQGDRTDMRQYAPGDPSRSIIWKVYARTRRLEVRMPERALTAKPRTCAYLVVGREDEATASFARTILESKLLGENWLFGADGCPGSTSNLTEAVEFLARSGSYSHALNRASTTLPADGAEKGADDSLNIPLGSGLSAFLNTAAKKGYHSCFVFVPPVYGNWIKFVKTATSSTHLTITWLMGFSHNIEKIEAEKPWERWIFSDSVAHEAEEPARVSKELYTSTTPVVLCEKASGRIINNPAAYFQSQKQAV